MASDLERLRSAVSEFFLFLWLCARVRTTNAVVPVPTSHRLPGEGLLLGMVGRVVAEGFCWRLLPCCARNSRLTMTDARVRPLSAFF